MILTITTTTCLLKEKAELIHESVCMQYLPQALDIICYNYSVTFLLFCDADVTVYCDKSGSSELMGSQDSSSTLASQPDSDHEDGEFTPRNR